MASTVTSEIDVEAPLRTVYNQWTQFETFPRFMEAVESIRQVDDQLTHWEVSIGGVSREFDAVIVSQEPDDHIEWRSVDERMHTGRVSFHAIDAGRTRVVLAMAWEPETFVEKAGAKLGVDERQVRGDLERFATFIQERPVETGAWRGDIEEGAVRDDG
ncbi:SRPBCC family protein [Microbacterium sp. LRZ72]|uniref:SRPBCC family protein n=1 Tax=Microbacterium sp. LRZ72 TaxID=2942481 RepID=UPI0029A4218B|nr:SRPBCC family protein [Microbacterium sp. LRZ72]MDX2376706.1 SRPBCC family protein [Microbacterium sp. LRZ72]